MQLIVLFELFRQIKNLEQLLEERFHQTESEFDTDSNIRSADCDSNSKPMLDQLRHMMQEKNQELEQRSLRIDEMSKEIDLLNNSLESLKDSNKVKKVRFNVGTKLQATLF